MEPRERPIVVPSSTFFLPSMSTSLTSSFYQWQCSLRVQLCIHIRPGDGMETHRSTRMDSLSSPSADAVSAASGGLLTAAVFLLLSMIFVALLRLLLRYFFSSTGVALAPAPRGVSPKLLSSLPITVYRVEEDRGAVECAVCLAGLEDGEEARFLPRCGHGFHAGCVDRWLASRSTCPLCRVAVVGKSDVSSTSRSLRPVPPEPANYARNLPLPADVLMIGVPNQAMFGAVTGDRSALATAAVLVIDIPESRMVAANPRDESKSPAGILKRLWSFERQGPSPSTSTLRPAPAAVPSEQHTSPVLPPRAPV